VCRTIRLAPTAATVDYSNLVTGEQPLRAVGPEARVTLNGTDYPIGGLDQNATQDQSGLKVAHTGNVAGWTSAGFGAKTMNSGRFHGAIDNITVREIK